MRQLLLGKLLSVQFLAILLCGLMSAQAGMAAETRVFAAASLVDVLGELADKFKQQTGRSLTIVPGASSVLAHQVISGAPAGLFISADPTYAEAVAARFEKRAYDLFGNSLVIIAPEDFEGEVDFTGLAAALGEGRLALGDPTHVPAGIYAKQALVNAGLWDAIEPKVVPAADVRAAVSFVARKAVPFGIVYKTDAKLPGVKAVGTVPDALHKPVRYWGVVVDETDITADLFLTYIISFDAQNRLDYAGFKSVTSQ